MKCWTNKFVVLLFVIIQSNIIAQNDSQITKPNYTLSDTTNASEYYVDGKRLLNNAKYDSSIILFQKAIDIYGKLLEQYDEHKFWVKYIQAKNYIGYNLCYLGRYDESIRYLSEALSLCLDKLGEDNLTAAQIYQSTGIYYDFTEDLNKSLEMFQNALVIRKNILGEMHSDVGDSYNSIGIIYSKRSNKDKALEYFLKSLEIKKSVLGNEQPQTAVAYNNIGINYYDRGDYGKALEYYQNALSIRLNTIGEQHHLTASSYNNIGNCYMSMQEYDLAEINHLKSLDIRKTIFGNKHDLVATSYNNLGLVYYRKNELKKALDNFNNALTIRLEIFNENHPSVAQSYMNIGLIYNANKDYYKAIEQYNKSLKVWKSLGESKRTDISKIYQNISEAYTGKQNYDSALIAAQKAIIESVFDFNIEDVRANPNLNNILSEVQLLNSLKIKANVFLKLAEKNNEEKNNVRDNLNSSLLILELADTLIDKMLNGFKTESSKYLLGEKTTSIYELAIETTLKLFKLTKNPVYREKTLYFIEKSKSAALQRGILESKARQFAKISPEILEKDKNLKEDLMFYNSQLQIEMQKKDKTDSLKLYNLQKTVFDLTEQYEKLIGEIETKYPSYYKLKYQTNIFSSSAIQEQITGNSVLINYFVGDSSIYLAVISKEKYEVIAVNKPQDFEQLVKGFYSSILKSETDRYLNSANRLSELLIKPVASEILNKTKLIIIPHDALFKVPFEALFTYTQNPKSKDFTKLNYLIKDFDIVYHYSATLFVDSQKEKKHNASKNFIGFAPVFPKNDLIGYTITNNSTSNLLASNDEVLRSVSVDGKSFDELKYSEWEVNSIIDLFNKNNSSSINTAYFYADAKEDSFKANVKDYKIVHIASHSFMNEEQPDISGVVFAQPTDSNYTNDGILYSAETYNLDTNADLVVLSGCESGLGKLFKGEGMIALTRGFLYSGVSNIIFSLWKIPDKHTSELMVGFYREIIKGKSYSESLRQAKLKLIKDEKTARPRSWAGFLLIGRE